MFGTPLILGGAWLREEVSEVLSALGITSRHSSGSVDVSESETVESTSGSSNVVVEISVELNGGGNPRREHEEMRTHILNKRQALDNLVTL